MIKRNLFYVFIIIAVGILVVVSLTTVNKDNAIVAVVESQKTAISYQKPVSVKAIHVITGQQVKEGQLLLEVDRPDLNFEYEKLLNQRKQEEATLLGMKSEFNAKLELLGIEKSGKINRLDAEISQLESEITLNKALRSDLQSITNSESQKTVIDQDSIRLGSYLAERRQVLTHYTSEKQRLRSELDVDLEMAALNIKLIDDELALLDRERLQLKKYAPFTGTIGSVNAQLDEIVPSFETIVSLYEKHPSTLKAFLNSDSGFILQPGDEVNVESSNREYSVSGQVLEVGARIVGYIDPARPENAPKLYGREIFISLPADNSFLYGEQVFVFPNFN